MQICVFGLGEAGSLIAAELAASGSTVVAFDPADVATPAAVQRVPHPALAVRRAELVLALTAAADARMAIVQAADAIPADAIYADFSTAAPSTKAELAAVAEAKGFEFTDVALVGMVPGNGVATRALSSGAGAERFANVFNSVGGRVEPVDGPAGSAARRKLLRSVAMKGFAAVAQEALAAAEAADDLPWLFDHLGVELASADQAWLHRLVEGTPRHAKRRLAEMEAARAMVVDLGQPTTMTNATVDSLASIAEDPVRAVRLPAPEVDPLNAQSTDGASTGEGAATSAGPADNGATGPADEQEVLVNDS